MKTNGVTFYFSESRRYIVMIYVTGEWASSTSDSLTVYLYSDEVTPKTYGNYGYMSTLGTVKAYGFKNSHDCLFRAFKPSAGSNWRIYLKNIKNKSSTNNFTLSTGTYLQIIKIQ